VEWDAVHGNARPTRYVEKTAMSNESLPVTNGSVGSRALTVSSGVAENQIGQSDRASFAVQLSAGPASDVARYGHAFRRHWLLITTLGLLCAAAVGPAVWYRIGTKYTANAFLRISMQDKPLLAFPSDAGDGWVDRDRFEVYKSTQQQYLLSRFVLSAALRKPEVAELPFMQRQQPADDPVNWLANQLSVSFPGKAEILEVSLSHRNPAEATAIVGAVVDAYLTEVINAERDQNNLRLSKLNRLCEEKELEVRAKRSKLKQLAGELGTAEMETLTLKQKLALEELTIYRQEMAKAQFEVRRLQSELAAQQALLKTMDTAEIPGAELDALVMNDPVGRQLFIDLGFKKTDQAYTELVAQSGAKSRFAERYGDEAKMLQRQYDARIATLRNDIRQKKRSAVETETARLKTALAVMMEQACTMEEDIQRQRKLAEQFGNSSIDIEMMRSDIKHLEDALSEMAHEREKLNAETRSASRVTPLPQGGATVVEANHLSRLSLTAFAMLVALIAPASLVLFCDVRANRINNCDDVSKGLGLPVIGAMPRVPARVTRRLPSPSRRCRTWQVRLMESVDSIAACMLRKAETEQSRVLMVTSAVGGEGKTTLALQLALSLARTGRRTMLVDFDLRRPACHEVFHLPLEPGVCDVLRKQTSLAEVVHATERDHLAVLTAGRLDRLALAELSNGVVAEMFRALREMFDFIVVDTSPILPVADARFVSQHVDGLVLSVFRDVSEAAKVQAACEILKAFGVPSIDAVVVGANGHGCGEGLGYTSKVVA
jgi:capsular exopolysaccharide synthesis family protein